MHPPEQSDSDAGDGRAALPSQLITRFGIEVVEHDDRVPRLQAQRPLDHAATQEIAFLTGLEVSAITMGGEIGEAAPHRVGATRTGQLPPTSGLPRGARSASARNLSTILDSSATIDMVDELLRFASDLQASDIHVEPYETGGRVRLRLDGVLHEVGTIPAARGGGVVARVKIMAALDIAEKRRPQDGRLRFEHGGRPIDVRVSTLPTAYGEKVVLRLLDRSQVILDLGEVGLAGAELETFSEAIACPHGMIVVTGPTGSGKTTTLYAALATLNREDVNVLTAEDPVEYDLPGVNQVRARPEIGFSFAEALRAFLRQDPDVIMVGEVRDRETAEIAVRAALTGHLVLTTLHTNDAATAVTRLVDMGVEPYLVAASLRLVAAQRLVRKVCPACARDVDTSDADAARLGGPASVRHRAGAGCERCAGTGYRGRSALFELMPVGEDLAARIAEGADAGAIRALARAAGMRALREAGCAAVAAGITTPAEVLRATA